MPIRNQSDYWTTIEKLSNATSKKAENDIRETTGISHLALCVASLAFLHPSFFPLDPFHLFYENCMAFLWDLWIASQKTDLFYMDKEKLKAFGELISQGMSMLPSSFCGPIHDPFLKRNSQYKIYEWMALLHWYIIPMGVELGLNSVVLENFSLFVEIIEFAMTLKARSQEELQNLYHLIVKFLQQFERIYVGNDPSNISRARLCIFQLIHIPRHIAWNGSIRIGSQATVERCIGEMGRRVQSKKAVFANLANQIHEREMLRVLLLKYPSFNYGKDSGDTSHMAIKPVKKMKISKKELASNDVLAQHLNAISIYLDKTLHPDDLKSQISRWGKVHINEKLIHSCFSGSSRGYVSSARQSQWFEVYKILLIGFNITNYSLL